AEAHEPDPVALAEIPRRQPLSRAQGGVEGASPSTARFCEDVEEDDHVGVALRMMLVDPELTAAGACAPVHVPDPISGDELTDVGELDPLRLLARHMVSRKDLCLRRPQQGTHGLLRRVHLERPAPVAHSLVPEHAERIVRTEVDPPERERTPADTTKSQMQATFFSRDEMERARVAPFFDLEPGRELEQHVDLFGPIARAKADPDVQQFPFQSPLAVE